MEGVELTINERRKKTSMFEQMYGLNKLKDVLKNNGIKQIFVAEKIGATKQEISKFVGGKAALSVRKYESLLEWLKNYN